MTLNAELALTILGILGGLIVWVGVLSREWTRLEGRVKRAEERHDELRSEHRELKRHHFQLADTFREAFGGQFKILRLPRESRDDDPA